MATNFIQYLKERGAKLTDEAKRILYNVDPNRISQEKQKQFSDFFTKSYNRINQGAENTKSLIQQASDRLAQTKFLKTTGSVNRYLGLDRSVLNPTGDKFVDILYGAVDPQLRNIRAAVELINIPSYAVGGALKSSREAIKGTYQTPQHPLGKYIHPLAAGVYRGVTQKQPIFEELPKTLGMDPSSLGGLAVGLAGELAVPDPMDLVKLAKAGKSVPRGSITRLEKELDNLLGTGGSLSGNWKRDYHFRNRLIEETKEIAPKNVVKRVEDIQEALDILRSKGKEALQNVNKSLLSETSAQTKFRREAGLIADEVYDEAQNFKSEAMRNTAQRMNISKVKKDVRNISEPFEKIFTDIKKKVNWVDYLKTPDRVLEKIGLDKEAKLIRVQWDKYLDELPEQIEKISNWSKRVPAPDSNKRIFRYLDGIIPEQALNDEELKVAGEVKTFLRTMADRLGLPEDKRITNYITHIWDEEAKEFPEEIAGLIRDKVAGSVYDPFVQKRLGAKGYVEDTWKALEAYTKRAVRKIHMDDALVKVKDAAEELEDSQYKYVKNYIDKVNLRPSDIDNAIDNFVKSSILGYKLGTRPVAKITRNARSMVYRGLLGMNVSSALKNLLQGANTYAELGEKYTLIGYAKVIRNLPEILAGSGSELHKAGILKDGFVQDRNLKATRTLLQKVDEGLFYLFNLAERINRGSAFWGAKAKFLKEGLTEAQAIQKAKDIVRKTQFTFGQVDTPVAIQSDLMKTFAQFQTYSLKQVEFLGEKIAQKDFVGLVRYIGATYLLGATMGKLFGWEAKDLVPSFRFGAPPTLQLPAGLYETVTGKEDQFGNKAEPNLLKRAMENWNVQRGLMNYIPGGAQLSKTFQGVQAMAKGGSFTDTGRLRYPVTDTAQALVFGPSQSRQAQEYRKEEYSAFSPTETELYQALVDSGITPDEAYKRIRGQKAQEQTFKSDIESYTDREEKGNWLFNLLNRKKVESVKQNAPTQTGDPLIDAILKEKEIDDRNQKIREIFQLGISKEQIETLLSKYDLGTYEEASVYMMKGLGVENGNRPDYLKSLFKNLSDQEFRQTALYLAENKVLTNSVVDYWTDNGEITTDYAKQLKNLIKSLKPSTAKKKSIKPRAQKVKVTLPKAAKPKAIKTPPKINYKPLKPKTYNLGVKI